MGGGMARNDTGTLAVNFLNDIGFKGREKIAASCFRGLVRSLVLQGCF